MIRHQRFLAGLSLLLLTFGALLLHGQYQIRSVGTSVAANRAIVTALGVTDLAIWTEARYTRHPSQTDFFSAFQDFPAALEHFPAGAILAPPPALVANGAGNGILPGEVD